MQDIPIFAYQAPGSGPHLLILGAIHGDEICGTFALAKLKLELDTALLKLERGRLTLAPVCNPSAYKARKRFITANLNRIISRHVKPEHDEHRYAGLVAGLIESADVVLDLHSYSSGSDPFLFLDDPSPEARSLAAAQQIAHWVTGWLELPSKEGQGAPDIDTLAFARSCGKVGVVVECGQHNNPAAIPIAYRCVRNTLAHLDMMAAAGTSLEVSPQIDRVEIAYRRKRAGTFATNWQHLNEIKAGQPIATYDDGEVVAAEFDGVIMLPHDHAEIGHEWFYLGRHTSPTSSSGQ